jgi:hypothetical protein
MPSHRAVILFSLLAIVVYLITSNQSEKYKLSAWAAPGRDAAAAAYRAHAAELGAGAGILKLPSVGERSIAQTNAEMKKKAEDAMKKAKMFVEEQQRLALKIQEKEKAAKNSGLMGSRL